MVEHDSIEFIGNVIKVDDNFRTGLDIGCETGEFTQRLSRKLKSVVEIDISFFENYTYKTFSYYGLALIVIKVNIIITEITNGVLILL